MNVSLPLTDAPGLSCEQTVRRLWDYLDHQLSAADTRSVEQHLRDCQANCASHFEFERTFLQIMRGARPTSPASDVLRARVTALIANSDYPNRTEET